MLEEGPREIGQGGAGVGDVNGRHAVYVLSALHDDGRRAGLDGISCKSDPARRLISSDRRHGDKQGARPDLAGVVGNVPDVDVYRTGNPSALEGAYETG